MPEIIKCGHCGNSTGSFIKINPAALLRLKHLSIKPEDGVWYCLKHFTVGSLVLGELISLKNPRPKDIIENGV